MKKEQLLPQAIQLVSSINHFKLNNRRKNTKKNKLVNFKEIKTLKNITGGTF